MAYRGISIVLGVEIGQRMSSAICSTISRQAARAFAFCAGKALTKSLVEGAGTERHAKPLGERLGADFEVAGHHRALLTEEAQHGGLASDRQENEELAGLESGEMNGSVQERQGLHIQHPDVDRRQLERPHAFFDPLPGNTHGQDLVRGAALYLLRIERPSPRRQAKQAEP
jgi:hypothetical protein